MTIRVSRFFNDSKIVRHPGNPSSPLVSVIMPTYRLRPGELNQRAIESVLSQTLQDFEFIIVDDGSIDGLYQVLLDYQSRDSRVVLIRNQRNSGLPALRVNEGLLEARGKYVAYMFDDDLWFPEALAKLVETMIESPEECLVYGAVKWTIHRLDKSTEHMVLGDWDFNYGLLKNCNKIANCGVLHPRALLDRCGLYDPHVLARRFSDYDLWLRMGKMVPFRRCNAVIGEVTSGLKYALGSTVDQNLILSFRYLETDRNSRLVPKAIASYEIDSLRFVADPVEANRIREHYIIPFWEQHPFWLTPGERKKVLASREHPNRLLVTKGDYSTSVDVTLGNFDGLLDGHVQSLSFLQERSLAAVDRWSYDTLVLYRTIGAASLDALAKARKQGKSILYFIDDNMFRFGTGQLAEEFAYLKPGTPGFTVLEKEVAAADLVASYTPPITKDCVKRNPRVIELRTNIRERYVCSAEPLEGGRESGRKIKYAILTGPARKDELKALNGEFHHFALLHKHEIEFHVWGMGPQNFNLPGCSISFRDFDHSYESYLRSLSQAKFDFVLCPLFADHETKTSKSPIKYLEATAAGAVGIFSDMPVYKAIEHGITGLKVPLQPGEWTKALEASFALSDEKRRKIHSAAKAHILRDYTTESQLIEFLTVFEAAELHAALASHSATGGRAPIAYFFHESLLGGATLHLFQHARIASNFCFKPILCFPSKQPLDPVMKRLAASHELEIAQLDFHPSIWFRDFSEDDYTRADAVQAWLQEHQVRLVHTVTCMTDVVVAARQAGLPVAATLHQYYGSAGAPAQSSKLASESFLSVIHSSSHRYARKWQEVMQTQALCIRALVLQTYFANYLQRKKRPVPAIPTLVVSGTLQPRKGQLQAIKAVGALAAEGVQVNLILVGYADLKPDYVGECRKTIRSQMLEERVTIAGFVEDPRPYYESADYLLCSSDDESFPQSILKAMASGLRVITTPVGGVTELVQDGVSGVVTEGMSTEDLVAGIERALKIPEPQWQQMVENAHLTASMACHEEVVAYKLLKLYNVAARKKQGILAWPQEKLNPGGAEAPCVSPRPELPPKTIVESPEDPPKSSLALRNCLRYCYTPSRGKWMGLDILVGTHQRSPQGRLVLSVRSVTGQLLRASSADLAKAQDNDWLPFRFPPIANVEGRGCLLELRLLEEGAETMISLYESNPPERRLYRLLRRIGVELQGNSLYCRSWHES